MVGIDHPRQSLIRTALWLEWVTIGWLMLEAAVAVVSGVWARSISLIAFGLDSLIELASAGVLIWRLASELWSGRDLAKQAESIVRRIAGSLLFALAAYVVSAAGWSLWRGEGQAFAWPGLGVAVLAMPIMFLLARRKRSLAQRLGSAALRADAAQALACLWLSAAVIIGLVAQLTFGSWWIDAVTSLAIGWFLVREGREAWEADDEE